MARRAPPAGKARGDTRTAIIAAAERLFIKHGFAGTSIRDIAQAAGVTVSLVMHHGGSKAGLWSMVNEMQLAGYGRQQAEWLRTRPGTPDLLIDSMRAYFRWLMDNPQVLRLKSWRDLETSIRHSPAEDELHALARLRMHEARDRGWFRADIDVDHVLFAVFTMLDGWFTNSKRDYCPDAETREASERYLETVLALLRHGLITEPEGKP